MLLAGSGQVGSGRSGRPRRRGRPTSSRTAPSWSSARGSTWAGRSISWTVPDTSRSSSSTTPVSRAVMAVDNPGAQHLVRLIEELGVPDHARAGTRTVARLHLVDPSDTDESARSNDPTDDLVGTDPSRTDPTRTPDATGSVLGPFGPGFGRPPLGDDVARAGARRRAAGAGGADRGAIDRRLGRVAGRRARWSRHPGQHRRRAESSARRGGSLGHRRPAWSS